MFILMKWHDILISKPALHHVRYLSFAFFFSLSYFENENILQFECDVIILFRELAISVICINRLNFHCINKCCVPKILKYKNAFPLKAHNIPYLI